MTHRYPEVKPAVIDKGIRMASIEDIEAMKFNVITRQPERLKDYIDVYSMLQHRSLNDLTKIFGPKIQKLELTKEQKLSKEHKQKLEQKQGNDIKHQFKQKRSKGPEL